MQLTQVVEINPNDKTQEVLSNLSKISNGLYNSALYLNCKTYGMERKFVFYVDMCKVLKENELYGLLASQSAQAVLQKVEGGIKSFLKLRKNGHKKAEFPHYHKKDTEWMIPYKSQQIKIKKNRITLPMSLEYRRQTGISYISFKIPKLRYKGSVQYVELFKIDDTWKAHLVFEVKESEKIKTPKKENLYVDLGVKNLATVWDGEKVTVYTGRKIASVIQYKDKKVAQINAILATHGKKSSKEKMRCTTLARVYARQAINSMTTEHVNKAKAEGKGIVIGDLNGIRDNMHFSKRVNQQNHQWQYAEMTRQYIYKCQMSGVRFRMTNEKDSSKTCVLCGQKENGRIYRGLYRCKLYNVIFNADACASLNIEKKYLQLPLSKGSGIGVVDAVANPAVVYWNEHRWAQ